MATRMQDLIFGALPQLRIHPMSKWIRASVADTVVIDTRGAFVVWEPRRVLPQYAVPVADVIGELVPAEEVQAEEVEVEEQSVRMGGGPPVLDPRTPFAVHTCPGTPMTVRTTAGDLAGAAFAPDDPDLAGLVVLDWRAFDQWYEEDEPVTGHPHDPFDRIDCLRSSRHVVVSLDGVTLADSSRPTVLFETPLPLRYYLPRDDVRMDLLERSELTTVCAYKGVASYWSARTGETVVPNLAWSYEEPLHDAAPVRDLVCFFSERVDLEVDGVAVERPVTPWS